MAINKSSIGFSLIEFTIVIALLAVMATLIVAALNPRNINDKGHDTKRKNDIRKIGMGMEEYFSDKGCYPDQALLNTLQCGETGFKPWIAVWPCDPNETKYFVFTENSSCPKYYRILTNLKNRSDEAIPTGWYEQDPGARFGDGSLTINDVNYGVSSANINWEN